MEKTKIKKQRTIDYCSSHKSERTARCASGSKSRQKNPKISTFK